MPENQPLEDSMNSENSGWATVGKGLAGLIVVGVIGCGLYGLYAWGMSTQKSRDAYTASQVLTAHEAEMKVARGQMTALHFLVWRGLEEDSGDTLIVCIDARGQVSTPGHTRKCQTTDETMTFPITYTAEGQPILGWPAK